MDSTHLKVSHFQHRFSPMETLYYINHYIGVVNWLLSNIFKS